MTKLISGRVAKVPSANVSADRYDFIELSETEPDLGLPEASGYVLSSTPAGIRSWINPASFTGLANVSLYSGTANIAYFAYNANIANTVSTLSNFTTANLVEGINLYFTNARVVSALVAGDNITIEANGRISATTVNASTLDLTTADVRETSNLYFTYDRVVTAVTPLLTSANVVELTNLYFTNTRVLQAVTPLLTTSNVTEIDNLYFTNARVLANVEQMSVNVLADVDITGILNNGILVWNGTKFIAGTIDTGTAANIAYFAYNANIANTVSTLSNFTTADLTESSSNLYFTNARVVSALIAGQNIIIEANGRISADTNNILSNVQLQLDNLTSDVIPEGTNNLYYTNSRVRSTLSGGTGVVYDSSAGSISIGQNVATTASVTFKDVTVTNNLKIYGDVTTFQSNNLVVSDNMIYLNNASNVSNPDLGIAFNYNAGAYRHGGFFRDASDGTFKVFDNYQPEPDANIFINTDHASFRLANLQATNYIGNVTGFVTGQVSSLDNLDTSALKEGSNLYFTSARVNAVVQPFLTTANVIETSSNLYFTTARVNATVRPFLTTANVIETSGNLYFTNARVVSALIAGQNIIIEANGRISANTGSIASSIADTIIKGNLTLTGSLTANSLIINGNEIFANEQGANLYVTRIVADSITSNNLTLSRNLVLQNNTIFFSEVNKANLAYTPSNDSFSFNRNFRVGGNLTIGGGVGGNISGVENLTTNKMAANSLVANILVLGFGSGGNITGAENITTNNLFASNIFTTRLIASANIESSILKTGSLIVNGNEVFKNEQGANLTVTNIVTNTITANSLVLNGNEVFNSEQGANLTVTRVVTGSITSNTWNRLYTANVIETSGNLYFTNARVVSALIAGQNIVIESNGRISANLTTSVSNLQAQIDGLTTDLVPEGSSNKYFTNARVLSALTGNVTIGNLLTTGQIVTTAPGSAETGAGQIYLGGVTNNRIDWAAVGTGSPTFTTRSNGTKVVLYPSLGASTVDYAIGIDAATMWSSVPEYGDSFKFKWFGATTEIASLSGTGTFTVKTIQANIWNGLYTSNVIETSGNLYFTNARVIDAVTIGVIPGSIEVTGNLTANGLVIRGVDVTGTILAGNITSGTSTSNIIIADSITANTLTVTANIVAFNNLVANGLIIQGINVTNNVLAGNVISGTSTSNIILADSITANVWNRLYTANVIETAGNLYFTNARVVAALIAGDNITIENDGRISANLPVTVVNDSYRFISTGNTTYNIGTSVNDPKNVLVIAEGLIQLPVVDYTVSGTSLIFTEAPTSGANVEVRFFGVDTINSGRALSAVVDTFIGNGSNVNYTLSSTPPNKNYISIIIDGIHQHSDVYTLSNRTITFPEAPANGANIDIRVIGGIAGSSYNTRTFTGNGISNTFVLTDGFTRDTVLVFENGVAQNPVTDYDIVNNNLVFTVPPAANIVIQVRELGVPSLAGANVLAAIRGFDQIVGNLVPTLGASKNLGSPASPFDKAFISANGVVIGNTSLSAVGTTLYITGGGTTQQVATAASVSAKAFGLSLIFGG